MSAVVPARGVLLEAMPTETSFEVVAVQLPLVAQLSDGWPTRAGEVRWDAMGRPVMLHIGIDRWLLPTANAEVMDLARCAVTAGSCVMFEVTGKWQVFRCQDRSIARILSSSIDIDAILEQSECARLVVFDCPAIITRRTHVHWILIQRSYCASFHTAIASAAAPGSAPGGPSGASR